MEEIKNEVEQAVTAEVEPDYKALYEQEKSEREKVKQAFDKAASETAEYKRKLSERLTKEEADKLAQEEREKAVAEMLKEREQLLAEKRIAHYTAQMVSAGISAEQAGELASSLPDGISDNFFNGVKKFIADETTRIRAEALKQQPSASIGMPITNVQEKSDFEKRLDRAFGL